MRVGKAVQVGWTFAILEVGAEQGIFAKYAIDPEIIAFTGEAKKQSFIAMGLLPAKPSIDQLLATQFLPVRP